MSTMQLTPSGSFYVRFIVCQGVFDGISCVVVPLTASYGGGSTFDCYVTQSNITYLPVAGTGIDQWCMGDGDWGGHDFEDVTIMFEDPLTSSFAGKGLNNWAYG